MTTKEIKELLYFFDKSQENVHHYISDSDELIVKKLMMDIKMKLI